MQARAAWVAKYREEARFGLPLNASDPLTALQRAECVLALHLLVSHPPDGVAHVGDGSSPPLRPSDFIEPDRLEVLAGAAASLLGVPGDDSGAPPREASAEGATVD
mmetsp:Transcript_22403/g.88951  ORF Transcript_22403/g.88951 Transcript_22403/m.88951 type:complete len:106 (+) Transcript_22403:519-836(+)